MSIRLSDVLFYGGGECFQKFGMPVMGFTRDQRVGPTFTRSGTVGPFTGRDGVLRQATANRQRIEWLDLDGDGILDTPALLAEAARTNLVSSDDVSAWSVSGTPVVTGSISDPAGGTGAYRIADDDGAAFEFPLLNVTFTADAVKAFAFVVREATTPAGGQRVKIRDTTAGADRLSLHITAYTDGNPSVTADAGTYLGKRYAGNGYWVIYARSTSLTAANTNRVEVYAAATNTEQGAIDVYRVNAFNSAAPSYSILDAGETRNADTWYATASFLQQPLTAYVKMVEFGTGYVTAADASVLHVGGSSSTGDPRLALYSNNTQDGRYEFAYDNGTAEVTAVTASGDAVSYGDVVELLCHLDYNEDNDGDIRISQSVDAGATSTPVTTAGPSGGLNAGREWNLTPARTYLGSQAGGAAGLNPIISAKVVAGVRTMDEMRALFAWRAAA